MFALVSILLKLSNSLHSLSQAPRNDTYMPKFVIAHKSGAHRLAAIALYRALVSQCRKLDIPAERGDELHNLIKNRFSSFRHTTSHRELKLLFEAGYEAVDHLDAAVAGEDKSKQYVLDLLRRAPYGAKKGNAVTRRFVSEDYNDPFGSNGQDGQEQSVDGEESAGGSANKEAQEDAVKPLVTKHFAGLDSASFRKYYVDMETEASHREYANFMNSNKRSGNDPTDGSDDPPITFYASLKSSPVHRPLAESPSEIATPRTSIFERAIPREELGGTGKRQIPKIFSANQIPVLRFKKPQSPTLTGYLNSRIKQRQKRHDIRHALEAQLQLARLEDQWDAILDDHTGLNHEDSEEIFLVNNALSTARMEPRWEREIQFQLSQVNESLNEEKAKNRAMAEKMYAVIDRETKLAEEERKQEQWEEERRKREVAEGLEGLSDMVGDIMEAGDSEYRPLR